MCCARTVQRRSIFSISRTASSNNNEDCQRNTRPLETTPLAKSSTMKLPRYGSNNHNNSHHPFTTSSSSSSAAAADALRCRADDAEQNNNEMSMATTRRAATTAGSTASSSSSKSGQGVVRRCQSANASGITTSRRHTLPSTGDANIRKSRSHNVSTNRQSSCSRADENEDDEQPSGVRTPELPIPAPATSCSHQTNGDGAGGNVADEGDLTRMYDFATWNMYERIVSARRQRISSTTASTSTTSTSTASTTNPRHAPSRKKNHAIGGEESKRRTCEEENGGQQCNSSKTSSTFSTRPPPEFKSSNQGNKVYGSSSAVTVAAVASASSEAAAAAMTSSKPHLYCKRSSTVSDCESATLATADETDKSSTTSSSWSRTDSPGTFPVGGGGETGGGNDAFLNPLRTAGNGSSNPNCRISHHPSMMMTMMEGVDYNHHRRHQAWYYTNIGGSSMSMNGGVCLGGTTSGGRVVLPGGTTTSSPEDDNFIFQLEM